MPSNAYGYVEGQLDFPSNIDDQEVIESNPDECKPPIPFPEESFVPEVQTQIPKLNDVYQVLKHHHFKPRTPYSPGRTIPQAPRIKAITPRDRYDELKEEVNVFLESLTDEPLLQNKTHDLLRELTHHGHSLGFEPDREAMEVQSNAQSNVQSEIDSIIHDLQMVDSTTNLSFESSTITAESTLSKLEELIGPEDILPENQTITQLLNDLVIKTNNLTSHKLESLLRKLETSPIDRHDIFLRKGQSTMIDYLYKHLNQFDRLRSNLPSLIARLSSLRSIQAKAERVVGNYEQLKNDYDKLEKVVEEQEKVIEVLKLQMIENAQNFKQNLEKISGK
ncbi:hypothetical protein P9112_000445 [Eukaryota sp. TZLM1-RC]